MNETRLHELGKLKASTGMETEIKNYIIWQLSAMVDEQLADNTAKELVSGGFTLKGAVDAIRKAATHNVCSDVEGYKAVRKYLCIDGVVTDAEAALYFLRDIPKETIIDLIGKIKQDAPEVTKPMLDLDLDNLFG